MGSVNEQHRLIRLHTGIVVYVRLQGDAGGDFIVGMVKFFEAFPQGINKESRGAKGGQ